MATHAEPFNAEAKGEAGIDLRIVADGLQHVGIDHASAAELDPAIVPVHVGLHTRLRERKERRPEANMHIFAQVAGGEHAQHALEVGHRHLPIDKQPLHLVKHWIVRCVGRIGPIDPSQRDDSQRRLLFLHHADLHGAGLAAEQEGAVSREW